MVRWERRGMMVRWERDDGELGEGRDLGALGEGRDVGALGEGRDDCELLCKECCEQPHPDHTHVLDQQMHHLA